MPVYKAWCHQSGGCQGGTGAAELPQWWGTWGTCGQQCLMGWWGQLGTALFNQQRLSTHSSSQSHSWGNQCNKTVTKMAEQPRNTWSEVQHGWAWRLQLKVTCNSCSEASEQFKIGNIAGEWGWQLLYLMGRCCQQRGGWAMAGGTMIMGDDDVGRCWGQHPTPWQNISSPLESSGREEKNPLVHRAQVLVGAGQFVYCCKVWPQINHG